MSDSQQKIIHIDMDCFYAAVEMRENPHYQGKPLAVGSREKQRGIISACNYEARKFGIHSAMSTAQAFKLCPQLILTPVRFPLYKEISAQIHQIFHRYTSIIEPLSLDEAYLDVTHCKMYQGSATLIAQAIRRDIWQELQLTASAGVAPLKFLAKVASDLNKPNGQCVIPPNQVQLFIDQLTLNKIPGVGKVALAKLHQAGFYCCKDIRESQYRQLLIDFGRLGFSLWEKSHGIDHRTVQADRERKSVGVETTLTENITTFAECWSLIEEELFPQLERRLSKVRADKSITKQGIKLKFADFKQTTIEHSYTQLSKEHFHPLLEQILQRQQQREIRLIGLNVILKPQEQSKQLSFFP